MPLAITTMANRNLISADPDADFQAWKGIAGDGNVLRFSRIRSGNKRCWCTINDHASFVRLTQGLSFNGHFATDGEAVIATNQMPGTTLKIGFDPPIFGLGVDIEPIPPAVVPGQTYRVELTLNNTQVGESQTLSANGTIGACKFIAAKSDRDNLDEIEIRVSLIDNTGHANAVDFGINRLELLAPVGNIA
ncbi:hypothetical protein [Microvirga sp. M2]|uniref:hypothetical protein n=1 Tax=Microvirga sp. M2 TaxID=3073270 RepID=UPI0039C12E19